MTQTNLLSHILTVMEHINIDNSSKGSTIDEQFANFHKANPHVYEMLKTLALKTKRAGSKHYGMAGLFEVLRWTHTIETHGDEFKLNNNYRALYARLLMTNEPELEGFFKLRARRSIDEINRSSRSESDDN